MKFARAQETNAEPEPRRHANAVQWRGKMVDGLIFDRFVIDNGIIAEVT